MTRKRQETPGDDQAKPAIDHPVIDLLEKFVARCEWFAAGELARPEYADLAPLHLEAAARVFSLRMQKVCMNWARHVADERHITASLQAAGLTPEQALDVMDKVGPLKDIAS